MAKFKLKDIRDFRAYLTTRNLAISCIVLLVLLLFKRWFFVVLLMIVNWNVLSIKGKYGFASPIEVLSFGSIVFAYSYGIPEAIIFASSSIVLLMVTGQLMANKLIVNFVAFFTACLARFFSTHGFEIALAGPICVFIGSTMEFVIKLSVFNMKNEITKIWRRALNLIFYIMIYGSFGELILKILAD